MAERIDARFQEILSHFQMDKLEDDLRSLTNSKADRAEIKSRFSRPANAAMTKQDQKHPNPGEGLLLLQPTRIPPSFR